MLGLHPISGAAIGSLAEPNPRAFAAALAEADDVATSGATTSDVGSASITEAADILAATVTVGVLVLAAISESDDVLSGDLAGTSIVYPDLLQLATSNIEYIDPRDNDTAEDGTPRGRIYYDEVERVFVVDHLVSWARKTEYENFYVVNRRTRFTFTWTGDGQTYAAKFMGRPDIQWTKTNRWAIRARIGQL